MDKKNRVEGVVLRIIRIYETRFVIETNRLYADRMNLESDRARTKLDNRKDDRWKDVRIKNIVSVSKNRFNDTAHAVNHTSALIALNFLRLRGSKFKNVWKRWRMR